MARYSESELAELKMSIDLAGLIRSKGIELNNHGKDLRGLCPFHADTNPSMIITPDKNLFHCPSCGTGGDVISFICKYEKLSFRHAVDFLRAGGISQLMGGDRERPLKSKNTTLRLPSPVSLDADDQEQLNGIVDFYHKRLQETKPAQQFLESRGIYSVEVIEAFQLGSADRSLGLHLPDSTRVAGKKMRESLQKMGVLRESGHEHFNGSLVIPIFDEAGNVSEVYGRKLRNDLRKGTAKHLYLPGAHKGIWNQKRALLGDTVILCEALIDALTFWHHGFKNVTAAFGTAGFTEEMLTAFIKHKIGNVLIAYDRDEAGDLAAEKLAQTLAAEGIRCHRIQFPYKEDANSFALRSSDAKEAFNRLIHSAQFMDCQRTATYQEHTQASSSAAESAATKIIAKRSAKNPERDKDKPQEKPEAAAMPLPQPSSLPVEKSAKPSIKIPHEQKGEDHHFQLGARAYRVRGLAKNTSPEVLKISIRAAANDAFHVDSLDLYNARHRKSFIHTVADECKLEADIVKRDLGRILLKLEELIEDVFQGEQEEAQEKQAIVLTPEERGEALQLLKSPNLVSRIIADFRLAGLVGEDINAFTAYLAAVSRRTEDPLAIIIQSSSSAGKSSVMDAVLAFMPEEEQIRYTAMTGQSLFYMGQTELKYKILAISEEEGAEQASYALKILQSEKSLRIASTGKDAKTGRMQTQEYNVEGPCAIFMTTTNVEVDEELQNRCLLLTVNENREQTQKIHDLQRKSRTLEGMLRKEDKKSVVKVHQNAQRLLKPLMVVNPFAEELTFLNSRLRTRRDNIKYLNLINAVTLLHQFQREIKTVEHGEEKLQYIEVTPQDIEIANRLAIAIMGTSLDELAPQTRKLLNGITEQVENLCEERDCIQMDIQLTRREIREYTGWSDTQLRVHLERLVDMEYLIVTRGARGKQFIYELLYKGEGQTGDKFMMQLIDVDKLKSKYDTNLAGQNANLAPPSRPDSGAVAATSRSEEFDTNTSKQANNDEEAS